MLNKIFDNIALYRLKSLCKKNSSSEVKFNTIVNDAKNILLVLPSGNNNESNYFSIFEFLLEQKKKLFVLTNVESFDGFKYRAKCSLLEYSNNDKSKFNLPNENLRKRLGNESFDLIIDLNFEENLFLGFAINTIKSKFRIGFRKENLGFCYNFLIDSETINENEAYRSMLSSLKMF